jgi:hypothetical protein
MSFGRSMSRSDARSSRDSMREVGAGNPAQHRVFAGPGSRGFAAWAAATGGDTFRGLLGMRETPGDGTNDAHPPRSLDAPRGTGSGVDAFHRCLSQMPGATIAAGIQPRRPAQTAGWRPRDPSLLRDLPRLLAHQQAGAADDNCGVRGVKLPALRAGEPAPSWCESKGVRAQVFGRQA